MKFIFFMLFVSITSLAYSQNIQVDLVVSKKDKEGFATLTLFESLTDRPLTDSYALTEVTFDIIFNSKNIGYIISDGTKLNLNEIKQGETLKFNGLKLKRAEDYSTLFLEKANVIFEWI